MGRIAYIILFCFMLIPLTPLVNAKPPVASTQTAAPEASADALTPKEVAQGPQKVIVVLVEFPDKKHTRSTENIRGIVFNDLNNYYREVSYGLMSIEGDITDKWYVTRTSLGKLDIEQWSYDNGDMERFEREAVRAADGDVNFRDYGYVILLAAGEVWPHANCDFGITTNDGGKLKGFVVNERTELGTYAHELGHVLPTNLKSRSECGLPDLYSYEASEASKDPYGFVGSWDIMSDSSPAKHFSAWSKISLGWVAPEIVRLGPTIAAPINLQPLEKDSEPRAIVVPLAGQKSYVIEVRRRIGYDRSLPGEGVLVYLVDLAKRSGYGPVRVVDSHPSTKSLSDAFYSQGTYFEDSKNNVYLAVAYTDGVGFTAVVAGSEIKSLEDKDNDGLLDFVETQLGTSVGNPDSDGDGLKDGEEVNKYGTNPLRADTDQDGLDDNAEVRQYMTNPLKADTDGDGLNDGDEIQKYQTDPRKNDSDGDGLLDGKELQLSTNPNDADTDDDGLTDGRELPLGTDPLNADTDGDQLQDGLEVSHKTNPLNADTDGDGLSDGNEVRVGANPLDPDTDDDGWRDGLDFAPTNPTFPSLLIASIAIVAVAAGATALTRRRRRKADGGTISQRTKRSREMKYCAYCRALLPGEAGFCSECGERQQLQ